MTTAVRLSERIDEKNGAFTDAVKKRLLGVLPDLGTDMLEWLVMEHFQFSVANVDILLRAVETTARLAEHGVTVELKRNADEEDGHAAMYRKAMADVGTDMDQRREFEPTTRFLDHIRQMCAPDPSRALGTLYATETAAIFEHETFDEICAELCRRRGIPYDGTLIKQFHGLHLEGGVEQGHKDGLAAFVDLVESDGTATNGERLNRAEIEQAAFEAIDAMRDWWDALLGRALGPR